MNSLLKAIDANNECIALFDAGQVTDGLRALRRAYSSLWPSSTAAKQNEMERLFPVDELPQRNTNESNNQGCIKGSINQSVVRQSCGLDNGHFYIYDRILLLPRGADEVATFASAKAFDFTVRVSVLFNFALGYHIQGTQCGQERLLQIASKLYDIVLNALDDHTDDKDMSIRVLKCLALNNRAQIYYECGSYDETMDCIDEMCLLLMASDCLETFIDVEDVVEIRRNIKYIEPPTTARAA